MPQAKMSLDPQEQELLTVERRFDAALLSSDIAALDGILSERFFLNDFTGGVIGRSELLTYLGEGKLQFHGIVPHELSVQRYGDAGIVTGWTEMNAELQGTVSEVKSRFLHLYIRKGGTWRLVSAQGTVIAELDS